MIGFITTNNNTQLIYLQRYIVSDDNFRESVMQLTAGRPDIFGQGHSFAQIVLRSDRLDLLEGFFRNLAFELDEEGLAGLFVEGFAPA
jgi:hypothetical protein